jgi:hypothetical protein
MKKRLTEEQLRAKIAKAPLWIQDVANAALQERDEARAELTKHYETQKPSPVYVERYDAEHGKRKTFIDTDRVTIEYAGIELDIALNEYGNRDGKGIELRFCRAGMMHGQVAVVPTFSNVIELRLPENMIQAKTTNRKGK